MRKNIRVYLMPKDKHKNTTDNEEITKPYFGDEVIAKKKNKYQLTHPRIQNDYVNMDILSSLFQMMLSLNY